MSKNKGGRKGLFHDWLTPEGLTKLEGWARDGLTDEQIAHNIGIATGTLYEWKNRFPEIDNALKKGKEVVDIQVENALLKRALGFEYEETKIIVEDGKKRVERVKKYVLPDVTAQIFWLKNRRPDKWRDKHELDYSDRVHEGMKGYIEALSNIAKDVWTDDDDGDEEQSGV